MKTLHLVIIVVVSLVSGLSLHAQDRPLVLTDSHDNENVIFNHGAVMQWTQHGSDEGPVAVSLGTIRTIGVNPNETGSQYLLSGVFTGTSFTNPGHTAYDGTSDGVYNYLVEWDTGKVYRTNADWTFPSLLFDTAVAQTNLGITYDFRNNTLWILNYDTGKAQNFTQGGTALGSFNTGLNAAAALARDSFDGTFWLTTQTNEGTIYQYDAGGHLLRMVSSPTAVGNNLLGGEFETQCVAAPAGLVGWWPGDGWFNDIAGTSEGSSQGSNVVEFDAGKVNEAFVFDGSNFVSMGDPVALRMTAEVTMDGWVNLSSQANGTLFGRTVPASDDYAVFYVNGEMQVYIQIGGNQVIVHSSTGLPSNTWEHVAVTYDGSAIHVYLNGAEVANRLNVSGSLANTANVPFVIGGRVDNFNIHGSIDEVELFNRALTQDEVAAIYKAGSNGKCREGLLKITCLNQAFITGKEVDDVTGDDEGGIAISPTKVFLEGDNNLGAFNRADLSDGTSQSQVFGIFSDLHSQKIYGLADAAGNLTPTDIYPGSVTVAKLVELDPNTGATTSNVITLSTPITLNGDYGTNVFAGIFAGIDRVVLVDGNASPQTAYNIDIPNGFVTTLGTITDSTYTGRMGSESWATWGVAEYFGGKVYLVYSGSDHQTIYRLDPTTDQSTVVAIIPGGFSDMATFTVAPQLGRWYFHYEHDGFAGNRDETLGYADACFATGKLCDSNSPVITVPNDIVVNAKNEKGKRVYFQVSAVDSEDGRVPATANPPSGSFFPNGRTRVLVTATDSCGNTATKTFTVTVKKKQRRRH